MMTPRTPRGPPASSGRASLLSKGSGSSKEEKVNMAEVLAREEAQRELFAFNQQMLEQTKEEVNEK